MREDINVSRDVIDEFTYVLINLSLVGGDIVLQIDYMLEVYYGCS